MTSAASRCTNADGSLPVTGNGATEVCQAANTWPATGTAYGNGTSCSITSPGFRCQGSCPDPFDYGGGCTASGLATNFPGLNVTCSTIGMTAIQCGNSPDCCSGRCQPTGGTVPAPAYCK